MTCRHPQITVSTTKTGLVVVTCKTCGRWWYELPVDPTGNVERGGWL